MKQLNIFFSKNRTKIKTKANTPLFKGEWTRGERTQGEHVIKANGPVTCHATIFSQEKK